jgi:hypothetical protein
VRLPVEEDLGDRATIDREASFAAALHTPSMLGACTPRAPGGVLGIAINTPAVIELTRAAPSFRSAGVRFGLAGYCRFAQGAFGFRAANSIAFVAIDRRTHAPFVGGHNFVPEESAFPAPFVPDPDCYVGECFALDLGEVLPLPAGRTRYSCFAVLGPHRSNVLETAIECDAFAPSPQPQSGPLPPWLDAIRIERPAGLAPPEQPGIALSAAVQGEDRCVLSGFFRLPGAEASLLGSNPHAGIVLVLSARTMAAAINPCRDVIALADDCWAEGDDLLGGFTFELALDRLPPGEYGAFVSLAGRVSRGAPFTRTATH